MRSQKLLLFLSIIILLIAKCAEEKSPHKPSDIWDIEKDGIPKFIKVNYIELDKIYRISKFRSSVGHDYSDAFEHCRSMKHYFEPKSDIDWSKVKIYAPITGTITRVEQEYFGTKIEIECKDYPAFRVIIFHIKLERQISIGDQITAGTTLGTHYGSQTYSDIAIVVNDPTRQGRFISYFEVITDDIFAAFQARGASSRDDFIIPKALRDANPLTCIGDSFASPDPLESWVVLN